MQTIPADQIGFDFDGVIADIGEVFIRLARVDHGYNSIALEQITTFQVEECLDMDLRIVEKIFTDILEDSVGTGLKPMTGAIETLTRLTSIDGVTIITARPQTDPVRDWLEHHCGSEAAAKMLLVTSGDHDDKERYIRRHNLSYFIDDRVNTCVQLAASGLTPLVFSQPWNRGQHSLRSVESWRDIDTMLGFENACDAARPATFCRAK
ncbi:MAG: hypothetical protein LJE64_09545 [Desulfofustis sp.]|jgi:hypothetical protein|nr:hypothetical protein [Desulfofustis sp.]